MKILFIGDIFGRPGRTIVQEKLREVVAHHAIDLVIANVENAAAGFGITVPIVEELFGYGIEVMTTGNHVWDKREIVEWFAAGDGDPKSLARKVLRPANYPAGTPGVGLYEGKSKDGTPFAVMNLQGRVFMGTSDDPFRKADELLKSVTAKVIFVDIHAEATSEKIALGWYLDGRVTAVVGTHTHVPTADERILHQGTAYLTDVGMTGPYDSVIGVEKEHVISRFLSSMPAKFEAAKNEPRFCALIVEADPMTGRAQGIKRLMLE
jgi:2',3'-cyclic-nucleotide 2'-phosphodiesterase